MVGDPSVVSEGERPECGRLTEVTGSGLCVFKSFSTSQRNDGHKAYYYCKNVM